MSITQQDLAKKIEGTKYSFSMDKAATVSALRQLADDLESGDCLIQSVVTYRRVDIDDYPMSAVVLRLYENMDDLPPRMREVKELYSSEHQFPVDAALTHKDAI